MKLSRLWQPARGLFSLMVAFNALSSLCRFAQQTLPLNTPGRLLVGCIALVNVAGGITGRMAACQNPAAYGKGNNGWACAQRVALTREFFFRCAVSRSQQQGDTMTEPNQRSTLQIAAAMTIGAAVGSGVIGCASIINAVGSAPVASPFAVPTTFIPIAGSTMVFPVHLASSIGHIQEDNIWLKVNGHVKQSSDLANMVGSVAELISKLSHAFEPAAGNITYSGTPENVGPVVRGDLIECHTNKLSGLLVKIVQGLK